jgi:predicted RNase H-like nuclease (RuvC/YqgF family)
MHSAVPSDFSQIVKQAVVEAVRTEQSSPIELKQIEEALLKEREERKNLKAQLRVEKKQVEALTEKLRSIEKLGSDSTESAKLEIKRLQRDNANRDKENEILHNEISELRNEKIISEQLDEEHSAKMKVYTQDLMASSLKYQQDIQNLISKNEKLVKEIEVLKAKLAEMERQGGHNEQVQEVQTRKLAAKDQEISSLQDQIEKISRDRKILKEQLDKTPSRQGADTSVMQSRIKELEALIASQKTQIVEQDTKIRTIMASRSPTGADDAFGILRSTKSLTPARRVSHLTSRREAQSYAPVASDYSEWLEPLAIAEHVLNGTATAAVQ